MILLLLWAWRQRNVHQVRDVRGLASPSDVLHDQPFILV